MLVEEESRLRLERSFVVSRDDVGGCLRENVDSCLADDLAARQAELGLGHAIDKKITTVARIFHRNLGRYVIDDLEKESVIPVAFLLEFPPLGDILHRRNPAALCQR